MRTAMKAIQTTVAAILLAGLAAPACARQVRLSASLANPVLMADTKQTTYLKIGLTGFEMEEMRRRAPVNIAIVVDKSGSMQGEKIRHAREAALMAVDRLGANDIVSVVAYDDMVSVLVPATRASDKQVIRDGIRRLEAGGRTALFAGVSKGAHEIRKFLDRNRVNRMILLSDGLANVGPDSPGALGDLGASLRKEGISVTTLGLGLGYNEDLMTQLAKKSDGNHAFVEHPHDLARIFDHEFGDVLSVVAQEVVIRIHCANGVRPIRVLGRDADISGNHVVAEINQLYSNQEKYVLLEVEVPAARANTTDDIAKVAVSYANMETKTPERLTSTVSARFSESRKEVTRKRDKEVMVDAVQQVATERSILATKLRDEGKVEEAKRELLLNAQFLGEQGYMLQSQPLNDLSRHNREDAENLAPGKWKKGRKVIRSRQYEIESQQSY